MAKKNTKLGGSAKLVVGKRTYSSMPPNLQPQIKEVHTVTGLENAPRDISGQRLENLANTIRTNEVAPTVFDGRDMGHGKDVKTGVALSLPEQTEKSQKRTAETLNTSKTKVQPTTVQTGQEQAEKIQSSIQRASVMSVTPQTVIREKKVQSGYERPTSVKPIQTGQGRSTTVEGGQSRTTETINTSKTKVQPTTVQTGQEQAEKIQSSIQRASVMSVTPQTVIRGKKVQSGYERPTSVKPIQTGQGRSTTVEGGQSRAAETLNTSKTKVQPTTVQTGQEQAEKIQSSIQRASVMSVTPQTIIRSKPVVRGFKRPVSAKVGILTSVQQEAKNVLNQQGDSGTAVIATGITAVGASMKGVKAAQAISPYAIRVGQGTYNIGVKTIRVVRAADSAIGKVKSGAVQLNHQTAMQFKAFVSKKIMETKPMQRLAHAAGGVKTAMSTVKRYSLMVGSGTVKAVSVARGVLNGTIQIKISKKLLHSIANSTWKGTRIAGYMVGYGIKTGAIKTVKTGIKVSSRGTKGIATGVISAGNFLMSTDDLGTQAVGIGIKSAEYTARAVKTAPKILKGTYRGVRTFAYSPIKTGKAVYKAGKGIAGTARMVKQLGIKDTVRYFRHKAAQAIAKAGGSVANAVLQGVKSLGAKVVVPLILLIIVAIGAFNIITAPVAGVGAIFGGSFTNSTTGEDLEIHTFLLNNLEPYRQSFVQKVLDTQSNALSSGFHYVRLFGENVSIDVATGETPSVNERHTPIAAGDVERILSSTTEIVSIIEPLFQTIMLTEYDLEPTQEQIDQTLQELWDSLFRVETKELPIEYCFDATSPHYCGSYHADISGCPNIESGTHGSWTCGDCCYYYSCGSEDCSGNHHDCNGYYYCNGHKIFAISVNMDGIYDLLRKYFTDPIDVLANLSSRTPEQEDELQTLKDNYELCLAYMEEVQATYGGGSGSTDLSGVQFVNGTRPGNQAIVDLALQQVGNVGGQPYWSWYGFKGRVEWCACFVSWCLNHSGYSEPKFAACQSQGVPWFKSHGQWANGSYMEPVAGDIIFFDWEPDGSANHVGIVVGNDGQYVYTVEGNSGDACRTKRYPLSSSVIFGYGLPNY